MLFTMSPTQQRDQTIKLAKISARKALEKARLISDSWFRAQALSWVARFTEDDPIPIATQAAKAAAECVDDYQSSAVRSWEIVALTERTCPERAKKSLREALKLAVRVQPLSSRSEALLLLLQAAFAIHRDEAVVVHSTLIDSCPVTEHWRCKRAVKFATQIIDGELQPRKFFW